MSARVRVFEVLHDIDGDGPACDGTVIRRFGPRDGEAARAFAAANTCWGNPAKCTETMAPRRLAQRWGRS